MRILDLFSIALKNLRGRWMVMPALCIAVSMFCFCFAGTVLTTVQQEKSMPCELIITSEGSGISDSTIAEISKTPDVLAVTPILPVSMNVRVQDKSEQLTMLGIDADYLRGTYAEGDVFPKSSVMPYIVLNQETSKLFKNDKADDNGETIEVDWLNANVSVQVSEEARPVISKISGILSDDEELQEQAAYISLSCAKQLLEKSGQSTDYTKVKARIKNIGCAERISDAIHTLGLNVINTNKDLQTKWDMQTKEMTYLMGAGVLCFVCFLVLTVAWIKITILARNTEYNTLLWVGARNSEIRWISAIQVFVISLIGIGIGSVVASSLRFFITPKFKETSIFAIAIPFEVCILISAALIVFCMMVYVIVRKNIKSNIA